MDRVVEQVRHWRDELLSLSRRDRVLYYRPTKAASLLIEEPDLGEIVSVLQNRKKSWGFVWPSEPEDDPEPVEFADEGSAETEPLTRGEDELRTQKPDRKSLASALRILDRRANQEFMDKGIWVLYLAAGFLHWLDPDDEREVRTPIVLVPVEIHPTNPKAPHRLRMSEEEVVLNPALVVKMDTEFGVTLPEITDPAELDLLKYLDDVASAVRAKGWSVSHDAAIDIFSFYKEVMYKDLKDNEEAICASELIHALALGGDSEVDLYFEPPSEAELDERFPAERMATIRDADASQRRAVVAAQQGHSFVLDGPPGTGKSQTISNIISQAIHDGRTVLFVSEKIAALEVVKARLDEAGLGQYLLELHSHKATRKEVAQNLYLALNSYPRLPNGITEATIGKLEARRRELSAYADAMNEVRLPLGRSLHSAIGRVAQLSHLAPSPLAELDDEQPDLSTFNAILDTAHALSRAWGPVDRGEDFLWRGVREDVASVGGKRNAAERLNAALESLNSLRSYAGALASELELWWNESPGQAQELVDLLSALQESHRIPPSWLTTESWDSVVSRSKELEEMTRRHHEAVTNLGELIGGRWRELDPADSEAFREARTWLGEIEVPWPVDDDTHGEHINVLREFARANLLATEQVKNLTEEAAAIFGLDRHDSTIARTRDVLSLAELTSSSSPPEPTWLDGVSLPRVQEAAEVLGTVAEEYREKATELDGLFNESVLELDAEALKSRFDTVHRGLRKLGGAYRADKRRLAEHTHQGRATRQTIQALGSVIEWKRIARRVGDVEARHASSLGDYYQGVGSSFATIAEAIEVAEQATRLTAGFLVDREQFQSQLSRGGSSDGRLASLVADLRPAAESWVARNSEVFGSSYERVSQLPFREILDRLRDSVGPIEALASIATGMEQVAGRSLTLAEVGAALGRRATVQDVESAIDRAGASDEGLLGAKYRGVDTDWEAIQSDIAWANRLRTLLHGPVDEATAGLLLQTDVDPHALDARLKTWFEARDALVGLFTGGRILDLSDDLDASYSDGEGLIRGLGASLSDIDEWASFSRARNKLAEFGLAAAAEDCIARAISGDQVVPTIEKATLEAWIDRILDVDERLSYGRATDRAAFVKEFQTLDRKVLGASAARVMEAVNGRLPRTRLGPAGIIEREGQKKTRHMPVRDLIHQTKGVVQAFKPCFMMSPLSVSQFIAPDVTFDLVIFDEASQVKPSDAVNCVYRGHQLVIAGDQKQLPPTTFFQAVSLDGGDEYQEDQIDEFESVLDLAKAGGMESLPLRWHYRSQHEHLITYSNYSFYDGGLITFPGAFEVAPDVGIELFHVRDGQYRRGGARDNPVEAQKVVERVFYHAREHPDLTLGVVSFSEAQASMIEYMVDRARADHPSLEGFFGNDRLHGFFVKNLENVQGDERDIMIFSIGYGPDEVGKLTMNFGPLNRAGGERRLNVAITRARRRVEVVSSIRAEDFSSTESAGPRHLQRYLDFAERGMSALAIELGDSGRDVESPFEEEVLRVIRSWGYDVIPQVGVAGYRIDLGVVDPATPGKYILGVECDGAMYHSSKVARDRDRLRQEVLEGLGWHLYRIWGTSWYQDREAEERRLADAIEAVRDGRRRAKPRTVPAAIEPEIVEVDLGLDPDWVEEYEVCQPSVPSYEEMGDPLVRSQISLAIAEVVAVEGPVAKEVVLRRVRDAWGVRRTGHKIRTNFEAALSSTPWVRKDRRNFLWPNDSESLRVRRPSRNLNSRRSIDEVAPEELGQALVNLVRDSKHATPDELTSAVARLFGWQRKGGDIAEGLDKAVRRLLRSKVLVREGAYLAVNPDPGQPDATEPT